MTTTVAVTGAGGFLGNALVHQLVHQGYRVQALVRAKGRSAAGDALAENDLCRVFYGDINDQDVLQQVCAGAQVAFHLVSNFRDPNPSPTSHQQTNVAGTRSFFGAAMQAGVKRFVHCSTIGVHGNVQQGPIDESGPYAPGDPYQTTKLEAELWCREQAANSAAELVVVRPTSLYGPGDLRMLKMFRGLQKRTFPIVGPCLEHFHPCYIDDAVNGFLLAGFSPNISSGDVFFIGDHASLPLAEYIQTAIESLGAKSPLVKVPYGPMEAAAKICETVCGALKLPAPLNIRRIRFYKNNRSFDITRAKTQLGFNPNVGLRDGMQRTIDWYKTHGYL